MWIADLFTIELADGVTVVRLTSFDRDVSYGGVTWSSSGPKITRTSLKVTNTTDVSEMTVRIDATGDDYNSSNIKTLFHNGLFDGATVRLGRMVKQYPDDVSLGIVDMFLGRVSTTEITGLSVSITVKSMMSLLQQQMPRNVYRAGCVWALYSSGCGVDRASHTGTAVVGSGPNNARQVSFSGSWITPLGAVAASSLSLGTLTVTSGAGAGQSRTITGVVGSVLQVSQPLLTVPSPGDTLSATMGCSKTAAVCDSRFSNLQRRRSFDRIPPAEMAF